eukprot:1200712-Amphidinium_carterae.1
MQFQASMGPSTNHAPETFPNHGSNNTVVSHGGVRDRLANRTDPVARDSLALLWQKWARLEVYFGDAGALQRVVDFRDTEYQRLQ